MNINTSIQQAQEQIIKDFEFFEDWMDKYEHIIELGKDLPEMDMEYKTEENLVKGCQAQVWLHVKEDTNEEGEKVLRFEGDSDAIITKGLVALVLSVFNQRTPEEIRNTELHFIKEIGLNEHLSPTRANGLDAMIKRIRMYAQ